MTGMIGRLLCGLALALFLAPGGVGLCQDLSGEWEFHFMGHTLSAQVEHRGEALQGVAYLYSPFGKKDTYHFTGTLKDGKMEAFHHSGHAFRGEVVSPKEVRGVLRTNNGEELCITVLRR
jgi:hypothetical protein